MTTILIVLHVLACILLIAIVLLQAGKETDLASVFGGGSSQTAFGSRRGNIFTKITTVIAILFMMTSLTLTVISTRSTSIVKEKGIIEEKKAPSEKKDLETKAKEKK